MKFFYCKKCLMPSTRPRVTFNKEGICNACEWTETKKTLDWKARWKELEQLCDNYRSANGSNWDCIVPCSFGKDSYHIAWNMKHKLKMNPLLVYVSPLIPTEVGRNNQLHLISKGFDCLEVHINGENYKRLCKKGLIEQGRPQLAFVTSVSTAVLKLAMALNIKLLMYGEEGESEYGGRMDFAYKTGFSRQWAIETYFSGRDTSEYLGPEFSAKDLHWWHFPDDETLKKAKLYFAHWSYFENWDHILHRDTALGVGFQRAKLGLEGSVSGVATYTDYTSLDDPYMRTLHTHLMFLKFGFGRGTQEATSDIRVGAMTREEGVKMVKKYDTYDCSDYRDKLYDIYKMSKEEFETVLDKWANKAILEKVGGRWQLKKNIHHNLTIDNAIEIDYDGKY